ncbi:MAG: hypothetical protein PHG20_05900 [Geobacteraceae bacterium]|nr:hypothetical protein [Geobacteraceae bacterium]
MSVKYSSLLIYYRKNGDEKAAPGDMSERISASTLELYSFDTNISRPPLLRGDLTASPLRRGDHEDGF